MRKEKSRDAARSRRSKENHEFYELAKLLPLPAAITSQLDFLDKASIIRLTISFLKLRQFSVNGHPPWAPDFTTLGSINPYSSQSLAAYAEHHLANVTDDSRPASVKQVHNASIQKSSPSGFSTNLGEGSTTASLAPPLPTDHRLAAPSSLPPSSVAFTSIEPQYHQPMSCLPDGTSLIGEKNGTKSAVSLFDIHQGTHILQSLDGFAFAIGRDGRFLYISETVSMYLGLSQVEMTGSSVFDYTHQQDHEELARQLGITCTLGDCNPDQSNACETPPPASVQSQYSAASNETLLDDYVNSAPSRKRAKLSSATSTARGAYGRAGKRTYITKTEVKVEPQMSDVINERTDNKPDQANNEPLGAPEDPLVRQFCIRMKSTLTKRGCQHFKSSGYRVVHVVGHLRSYQSNDHGHLMDPLDDIQVSASKTVKNQKRSGVKAMMESAKEGSKSGSSEDTATSHNDSGDRPSDGAKIIGMVAVAIALPPPSINELKLESDTFVLRLGLDLKITHIEPKITELLRYPVELIVGRSLYSLVHPADVHQVQKCHKDLLRKGQMMSGYYRLLARNGGHIWIQTCATLICNNTLAGQTAVLPSSPTQPPSRGPVTHLNQGDRIHNMANFVAPQALPGADMLQYGSTIAPSKLASPSLSSHVSYDSQDQDQCVIFVNYMVTNIVDSEEILDICQTSMQTPSNLFAGTTSMSSEEGNMISNPSVTSNKSSKSNKSNNGNHTNHSGHGNTNSGNNNNNNNSNNNNSPLFSSSTNRSIYKAAFGLDVAGANYSHQQAAVGYPASYAPPAVAVTNTWDTTGAAVAAASNFTNHHHTQHSSHPYAHLNSYPHHQAAHNFGGSSAGSYYNYYGYYSNKFI